MQIEFEPATAPDLTDRYLTHIIRHEPEFFGAFENRVADVKANFAAGIQALKDFIGSAQLLHVGRNASYQEFVDTAIARLEFSGDASQALLLRTPLANAGVPSLDTSCRDDSTYFTAQVVPERVAQEVISLLHENRISLQALGLDLSGFAYAVIPGGRVLARSISEQTGLERGPLQLQFIPHQ